MTVLVCRTRMASLSGPRLWAFFFLTTASHGVLDAMTNGGLGVAFFAPFSNARYFFPWRPIVVSPISVGEFFGPPGPRVMWSALGSVWVPSAVVVLVRGGLAPRPRQSAVATGRRRPPLGEEEQP